MADRQGVSLPILPAILGELSDLITKVATTGQMTEDEANRIADIVGQLYGIGTQYGFTPRIVDILQRVAETIGRTTGVVPDWLQNIMNTVAGQVVGGTGGSTRRVTPEMAQALASLYATASELLGTGGTLPGVVEEYAKQGPAALFANTRFSGVPTVAGTLEALQTYGTLASLFGIPSTEQVPGYVGALRGRIEGAAKPTIPGLFALGDIATTLANLGLTSEVVLPGAFQTFLENVREGRIRLPLPARDAVRRFLENLYRLTGVPPYDIV